MRIKELLFAIITICAFVACSDDDSFSTSPNNHLSFSVDTVKMDTVFSNVPTSTRSFWVYNRSGDGIRVSNVRLQGGNQTGFRVNVDGKYLGSSNGYQTSDLEIRNKDSIRVFVELTSSVNNSDDIKLLEDNIIFTLESGVQQKLLLQAHTWDALSLRNLQVKSDTTIASQKPIIVYGGIKVDSSATLRISEGTKLYFHGDAGIEVYGKLLVEGTKDNNVVLRGDRLDNMFDYLPYDRVSGQWRGIHYYTSSYDNVLQYADIHSTFHGVVADSSDVARTKLTLDATTIHNCQGYGLIANNSSVILNNSQITNTLNDCIQINGGKAVINNCTFAQFYPFDSRRGVAFRLSSAQYPVVGLTCDNSLITGYATDEMMISGSQSSTEISYQFSDCVIRTPKILTTDSVRFANVIYENVEDTAATGKGHFVKIDTDNLRYDFRLRKTSKAIGKASATTALPTDRRGEARDETPDAGAYEYKP